MKHTKRLLLMLAMLVITAGPVVAKDYDLHQAVLDNNIEQVYKLLRKGRLIDEIGSRKYGYGSALHLAVREGHLEIAKFLLDRGAQVDVLDPDDLTPLHNAAWNGNLDMVKLLLKAGADIEASTYDGDTPLKLAQNNDQAKVVEFIQAKLQTSTTSDTGVIDISGTYKAEISGDLQLLRNFGYMISKGNFDVRLAQKGNQIKGTYGYSKEIIGQLYGDIEGDTIKFHISGPYSGKGVWKVNSGGNEIVGTFFAYAGTYGTGNWNLTKIVAKPAQIPDISGTYISEITGNSQRLPSRKPNPEVRLVQNGNEITGSFESRGKIWGEIEGDTIKFDFLTPGGGTGRGKWTVKPESNEMVGNWFETTRGTGKWNLTKIEPEIAPIPDISGTYTTSEITARDFPANENVQTYTGRDSSIEVMIKQNGDSFTGTISGTRTGNIEGVVKGNTINFNLHWKGVEPWSDQYLEGKWVISNDLVALNGTWKTSYKGHNTNGIWNLTKIESD